MSVQTVAGSFQVLQNRIEAGIANMIPEMLRENVRLVRKYEKLNVSPGILKIYYFPPVIIFRRFWPFTFS